MYASTILSPAAAFLIVALGTYIFFKSLGIKSPNLLFSRDEATGFQKKLKGRLGPLVVAANIFGTLSSLATVYVFFIGTSKVFGWFIFAAPISIAASFISTNWFTRRVLENKSDYRDLLTKSETTAGIVARLVWAPDPNSKLTSGLIKVISLAN